jgi:hypothetical protein
MDSHTAVSVLIGVLMGLPAWMLVYTFAEQLMPFLLMAGVLAFFAGLIIAGLSRRV